MLFALKLTYPNHMDHIRDNFEMIFRSFHACLTSYTNGLTIPHTLHVIFDQNLPKAYFVYFFLRYKRPFELEQCTNFTVDIQIRPRFITIFRPNFDLLFLHEKLLHQKDKQIFSLQFFLIFLKKENIFPNGSLIIT